MCGIGGVLPRLGIDFPALETANLFTMLEDRGQHASGFAVMYQDADEPVVFKDAVPARTLADKLIHYCSGENTKYVILHTRYSTGGSTANNGNNHPVVAHNQLITHNGVLAGREDDYIFSKLKQVHNVNRLYQVDTEAINAILRYSGITDLLEYIEGSMSCAWVDYTDVNTVQLFTNGGNPLVIGMTRVGHFVWASSVEHLEAAGFDLAYSFNAQPYKLYTLSHDTNLPQVEAEYVTDLRDTPYVCGMYYHISSYTQSAGYDDLDL